MPERHLADADLALAALAGDGEELVLLAEREGADDAVVLFASGFIRMTPRPGPASSGTSSSGKRSILPRAVATIATGPLDDVDADDLVALADARELAGRRASSR